MQDISQIWQNECIKTSNFIMSLACVMLKNYKEMSFYKFSEIRCNDKKINNEIIDFVIAFGGLEKTYIFYSDAYLTKKKHIICIYRYCNRFRIQPHRLRMSTDFVIVNIPIVYDLAEYNLQKVA